MKTIAISKKGAKVKSRGEKAWKTNVTSHHIDNHTKHRLHLPSAPMEDESIAYILLLYQEMLPHNRLLVSCIFKDKLCFH